MKIRVQGQPRLHRKLKISMVGYRKILSRNKQTQTSWTCENTSVLHALGRGNLNCHKQETNLVEVKGQAQKETNSTNNLEAKNKRGHSRSSPRLSGLSSSFTQAKASDTASIHSAVRCGGCLQPFAVILGFVLLFMKQGLDV